MICIACTFCFQMKIFKLKYTCTTLTNQGSFGYKEILLWNCYELHTSYKLMPLGISFVHQEQTSWKLSDQKKCLAILGFDWQTFNCCQYKCLAWLGNFYFGLCLDLADFQASSDQNSDDFVKLLGSLLKG